MDPSLLKIVMCPACGGELRLAHASFVEVPYKDGPRREVETGEAACRCGRSYPIEGFVLSFAQLFSPILQREAAYWEQYYLWLRAQGSLGFHDLSLGTAPYITRGITEPFPDAATTPHYTVHKELADHPLMRSGKKVLDVGVGLGWTSLYLARSGYSVTAIEPALGSVQAAKQYAVEQGISIEYICASLVTVDFCPASFDNVTAFHALHHELDLTGTLAKVRFWLRPGGALALDEHIGNSRLAASLQEQMHAWAESEVLQHHHTLGAEELGKLPQESHSPLEDVNSTEIVPTVTRLFSVHSIRYRHVILDHYPLLYYLQQGRDLKAFHHATTIANHIQEWLCAADPEHGDYVTIVATSPAPQLAHDGPAQADEYSQSATRRSADTTETPAPEGEGALPEAATLRKLEKALLKIRELERQLGEQGHWARSLEQQIALKDAEIAKLQTAHAGKQLRLVRALMRPLLLFKRK